MATNNIEVTFKASNMETLKRSISYWVKHFKSTKPGPINFMAENIPIECITASEGCQLYNIQIEGYSAECYKLPKQYGTIKSIFAPKSQCKVLHRHKEKNETVVEIPDWLVETWIRDKFINSDQFKVHVYTPEKVGE